MSNSVLCAVDLSNGEDDLKTIQTAARMAALEGSQLDVIAVMPPYGMPPVGAFFNKDHHDEMVAEGRKALDALITKALDAKRNDQVRHVIATGTAYDEVLKLAAATEPWLIVVGASKSEVSDYLLGPNAARIVRHSHTSVYVVR